jgi:hypothetical protein
LLQRFGFRDLPSQAQPALALTEGLENPKPQVIDEPNQGQAELL